MRDYTYLGGARFTINNLFRSQRFDIDRLDMSWVDGEKPQFTRGLRIVDQEEVNTITVDGEDGDNLIYSLTLIFSNEGRFDLAYKAIMQSAKAALQAKGYRVLTSKPGHHQLMLQALPLTVGIDKSSLILLDHLRKQRNAIDYSGDLVSDALTTEAITQAETLLNLVQTLLIPVIHLEDTNFEWIDPDDAPELTEEDLKRGIWKINGRIVSEAEGRAAFAERLRNSSKNKAGKT
ncbi:hypothetical protein [Polynucleobacter sp. UB-Piko-W3]|uniref:hypothetical protein n=1 Tax=Polynucleobacter sp. UB-Piko-W3 TaxID=1819735 RepID=UPI001C0DC837|nr:hypothetical protein [Polynucleobacter sp. UB-Piko-W3]